MLSTLVAEGYPMHLLGLLALGVGLLFAVPLPAGADWAFPGQQQDLDDQWIRYVGSVSRETRTLPDTYEKLEWYEFKRGLATEFCFKRSRIAGRSGSGDTAAIVVVDTAGKLRLALLEPSDADIKLELHNVIKVDCPDPY